MIIIMAETLMAGRQAGAGEVTGSFVFNPQARERQRQRERLALVGTFATSMPTSSETVPPTKPHVLILPNSSAPWGIHGGQCHSNHHSRYKDIVATIGPVGIS